MKVVTIDQMRALEAAAAERGVGTDQLMENAGLAVAQRVRDLVGDLKGEHVTVLVGPGNNGGDGLVVSRHLTAWGARAHVFLCAPRKKGDPNLEKLMDLVVNIVELKGNGGLPLLDRTLASSRVVVDAVLGTGRARPLEGVIRAALERLQAAKRARPKMLVVALDLPSGMDADTGACDPATPSADATVTLGYPKAGLFNFPAAEKAGKLVIADIGIPPGLADGIPLEVASADWVRAALPVRPLDANKGTFGRVLVVAGSAGFIGAAYLASAGAVRAGAGLVTLATPRSLVPVVAARLAEVIFLPLAESEPGLVKGVEAAKQVHDALASYNALLVGCGVGQTPGAVEMVRHLLTAMPSGTPARLVVDADGLNILSQVPEWWRRIQQEAILTPHPGEMRRLAGLTVEQIQAERLKAARDAAGKWRKTVLLKGAYSIAVAPDGPAVINPFANPALATAGTGDVLAGVVAGLLAQGLSTFHAAAVGAYVHGAAGELVRDELGDTGAAASDLLPIVPKAIKRLRA